MTITKDNSNQNKYDRVPNVVIQKSIVVHCPQCSAAMRSSLVIVPFKEAPVPPRGGNRLERGKYTDAAYDHHRDHK